MGWTFWRMVAALSKNTGFISLAMAFLPVQTVGNTTSTLGSSTSLDPESSSCNFVTFSALRSTWRSDGEVCGQKLPFEFWIYMKAEGTAEDSDASHVRNECLKSRAIGMVELHTPEDWDTTIMEAAPGQILRETKHAASYLVESPLDFEAMCADDQVTKVSRVNADVGGRYSRSRNKTKRRLKDTVSEAGNAHGVDVLIAGLVELGCQRTTGENQTLCILSDSFNLLGGQSSLQESGDLPSDEFLTIVEELPLLFFLARDTEPSDEGSAMTELAFDIARGANFKFNTFVEGCMMAADDVNSLGTSEAEGGEACDVLVDDIGFACSPGFRDGNISVAVDNVVAGDALYFSSAGNYRTGHRFTSNWECTTDVIGEGETNEPCDGTAVASHVFNPDATGLDRYLFGEFGQERFSGDDVFLVHWDDDEGTSRLVQLSVWIRAAGDEGSIPTLNQTALSDTGTAITYLNFEGAMEGDVYFFSISQFFSDLEDVEMRLMSWTPEIFDEYPDGTIFGQPCAASAIAVAAYSIQNASGEDGTFADPEDNSVEIYSSRGPCYINSGSGVEDRFKPVTTAATGLMTSTSERFNPFTGTSASAPVAAAIAAIVRAACFPKMVTNSDMIEMLTNYDYTIDATADAAGAIETWGPEAGYGIISAAQILGWIASNCQESCPGGSTPPTPVPTPDPITTPPVAPPTAPTVEPPTMPTVEPPIMPTVAPPTSPPVAPPNAPPVAPPTAPTVEPPTMPPVDPPTMPTVAPPTSPPVAPPTAPPVAPPTAPPVAPPTEPPVAPPTAPPVAPPTEPPMGGLVEVSERTAVIAAANAFDTRTSGFGCAPNGCEATNTRDGDLSTRWSCKEDLLDNKNCEITYTFEEPQDIVRMLIAFYKGDERTRKLKVKANGSNQDVIESSGETEDLETFELGTEETKTLVLEALGLDGDEWISLTEVRFMVL